MRIVGNSFVIGGGINYTTGRVEVCHAGAWGAICGQAGAGEPSPYGDDSDATALLVCRLYYGRQDQVNAVVLPPDSTSFPPWPEGLQFVLSDLVCGENDQTLSDCDRSDWGQVPSECSPENAFAVRCTYNPWS